MINSASDMFLYKSSRSAVTYDTKSSVDILSTTRSTKKDFSSLIKDPTNSVNELQDVINMIANNYKLNSLLSKFLGFIISKRRFFYVRTILQDFVDTCSKKRGEVKAELISSKELSGEQVNKIKDELSQNFNAKIKLDYKYDKSLIGGLVIQVGSIMVDTSIKNKLQQIENTMIEA